MCSKNLLSALISNLLEDEKYQRDAFAVQLIKQDSRHGQICSQVEQIQNELASLTMVEMTKRDLQVSPNRNFPCKPFNSLVRQ
jgi:hypothetical protein